MAEPIAGLTSTPEAAVELIRDHIRSQHGWGQEAFMVMGFNARGKPVLLQTVSLGTLTACIVHPREVFRPAIVAGCALLIVAHNHPSGESDPSEEDGALTQRLHDSAELLGMPLLDHLVITPDDWSRA